MSQTKKKERVIDSRDREILRFIDIANRPVSGTAIADSIDLSVPAIKPRLLNLKKQGIIKPIKIGGLRSFNRKFKIKKTGKEIIKRINSPSRILWGLDIVNERIEGRIKKRKGR